MEKKGGVRRAVFIRPVAAQQVHAALDPDLFEAAIQRVSGMWWSMKTKGNGEILIQAIVFRLAGSN